MYTDKARIKLRRELKKLEQEQKDKDRYSRYFDYIATIVDIADIELLREIWNWSLQLGSPGVVFRTQIEGSLPAIARKNGLAKPESFQQLIEFYEESLFTCRAEINECLVYYVRENDFRRVKQSIRKGADDWPSALLTAAEMNNLELVKFFVQKIEEDPGWLERHRLPEDGPGSNRLINYFIERTWYDAIKDAIDEARAKDYTDIVNYLEDYQRGREVRMP